MYFKNKEGRRERGRDEWSSARTDPQMPAASTIANPLKNFVEFGTDSVGSAIRMQEMRLGNYIFSNSDEEVCLAVEKCFVSFHFDKLKTSVFRGGVYDV